MHSLGIDPAACGSALHAALTHLALHRHAWQTVLAATSACRGLGAGRQGRQAGQVDLMHQELRHLCEACAQLRAA